MIEIQFEKSTQKGRAFFEEDNIQLAEMTFSIVNPRFIIIDHTEVNESLKGQEVGKMMLMTIVEHARNNSIKIMPLCPFAKYSFDKDPSIQDVLK